MRKYGLVTGSRSEYGLLRTLIKRINNSKNIDLKIIVTGSHLSKFHGETYKEIMKDGLNISKKIFLPIKKNNTKIDTTKFTGIAISKFADTFNNLKLDLVIILGDRYEIFAAAFSAMNLNIPVAHIHGGEKTLGSNDENMRHSITKLSNWHFVSTNVYKKRVIQLGENPKNVHYIGGMAYEAIKNEKLLSKKNFEKKIKFNLRKNNFLISYHPETNNKNFDIKPFVNILNSIRKIKNSTFIFSLSNADAGSGIINERIVNFVKKKQNKLNFF